MDDKIKEVMELVSHYGLLVLDMATDEEDWERHADLIETKLREMVQIPEGFVLVPVDLLNRVETSIGAFLSDYGWSQRDMDTADDLSAMLVAAPKETK